MPPDRSIAASAQRVSRALVIVSAIALSLLAFPSVFPWMLCGWLLWHTVLVLRTRPAYLPLIACVGLMIVKLVPRTPMILLFGLLLVVVAFLRFSAIRQLVLWSPIAPPGMWFPESHLSDDGIHSNPRGSEAMAAYVADALKKMYGEQILKSPGS